MNARTRLAASAAFGLSLLSSPLAALDLDNMNSKDRDAFGQAVRAYLLENPEVIMEAVAVLEQRQAAADAARDDALVETYIAELQNDGYSWVGGNPDGDITVVEFMDYRCGYCRRAVPEIAKLLEKDGNIRLVVKEFPILGEASMVAARFAIATKNLAGDDAYKAVHDALLSFSGEPTDVALRRLAEGLELDGDAILAAMNAPEVTEAITRTRALAQQLSISGTPSFVVDTELLRGYLPADAMLDMVAEIRAARG